MRVASRLTGRIQLPSELTFVVGVPVLWLVLYNARFWRETVAVMWHPSPGGALFIVSLFALALFAQTLLLVFLPRKLLRPVACLLLLVSALVAYFSDVYGVFMDKDMMRNVFATDVAEVSALLTVKLFAYLVLLGLLPCLLIMRIELPATGWKQRFKQRTALLLGLLAIALLGVLASSSAYASFFREHKSLRYLVNPVSTIYGAVTLGLSQSKSAHPQKLIDAGGPVTRIGTAGTQGVATKPLVLFLVIGETARAANFQLGGYERATNPQLESTADLIYFKHATSCGTATAISLPCIFAPMGRKAFDVDAARNTSNLLDMLSQAGLDVEWRDNQSGCKGVCARVKSIQYTGKTDSPWCKTDYCYDEQMLSGMPARLNELQRDTVFVFHQIGSHGPAYSLRYPPQFEVFKPACHSSQLDQCSREEVRNAYDNTILYTDHNLAQQIELLRSASDRVDSLFLYVSDHGESLGENGVYLHGLPYALAPDFQKQVPFMIWMSKGFAARLGIDPMCVRSQENEVLSHDNIFHTVMGALGVRNSLYRKDLDMFAACARAGNMAFNQAF
jgi:lipid A ethanolaminephosphotransferase